MNAEDVTDVTRNERRIPPELKLLIDLAASAAMLYYATHPGCLDDIGDKVREYRAKLAHRLSVWATRESIRSLPEIDT